MEIIVPIASAVSASIVSSLMTATWAFRRFRQEKWWERRAKGYDVAINALHDIRIAIDTQIRAIAGYRELPAKKKTKLDNRYSHARQELERAVSLGGYILSDDAIDKLTEYLRTKSDPEEGLTGWLTTESDAVAECIKNLIALARRDLGVFRKADRLFWRIG